MKTPLPPLQGLYCFYMAADAGSFKLAAEQMHITAAAMSQQIRQLEDRLGFPLFVREHRSIRLTDEGKTLQQFAAQAFQLLHEGVRQVSVDPDPNHLSLSVLPSFAQHWLVPRLGAFTEQSDELAVSLMTNNSLVDFQQDRVDLCVRFGLGKYNDLVSKFLMHDHLYPVAHPSYLEKHNIRSVQDLYRATLLDDERPDMNWQMWFELAGIQRPVQKPAICYKGAHVVLEGALAGQGVALIRHSLAWKFIEHGLISKLDKFEARSRFSYYLVAPKPYFKRPKVIEFEAWIQQEAKVFWDNSQKAMGSDRIILR